MQELVKLNNQDWDLLLEHSPYSSVFSSSWWLETCVHILGGKRSLYRLRWGEVDWLLPVFCGAPWAPEGFTLGAVGYGGPIPLEKKTLSLLELSQLMQKTEEILGVNCHRITSPVGLIQGSPKLMTSTRIINLQYSWEEVEGRFKTSVRTAIRKAEKSRVIVREVTHMELEEAHYLINETQKKVGAYYMTPKALLSEIRQSKCGNILGAFYQGQLIACSVFLIHPRETFYLFNGWQVIQKVLIEASLIGEGSLTIFLKPITSKEMKNEK